MWYIHNKYYSAIKTEIMPFAAMLMDQEVITISKVSQTEKDKYHMISLTGRMLKKKMIQINLNRNRPPDIGTKHMNMSYKLDKEG